MLECALDTSLTSSLSRICQHSSRKKSPFLSSSIHWLVPYTTGTTGWEMFTSSCFLWWFLLIRRTAKSIREGKSHEYYIGEQVSAFGTWWIFCTIFVSLENIKRSIALSPKWYLAGDNWCVDIETDWLRNNTQRKSQFWCQHINCLQ